MNAPSASDWLAANQQYLAAALDGLRARLEGHAAGFGPEADRDSPLRQAALAWDQEVPPALEMLCELFGLSPFERSVLLLCAGMELESEFAGLCSAAQGDPRRSHPTFGLALAALPDAHWSALSPEGPLRYWRLVETGDGNGLAASPLRIDERVLHYLTGVEHLDERLVGLIVPYSSTGALELVPSHQALAERLAATWARAAEEGPLPAAQLCGGDGASLRAIAAAACALLGLDLHLLPAQSIPIDPREQEALLRLWDREAALGAGALLLECGELDTADAAREAAIARTIEGTRSPIIVTGRERRASPHRPLVTLEVEQPTTAEQRALWEQALGPALAELDGRLDGLISQFSLGGPTIRAICAEAMARSVDDAQDAPFGDAQDGSEASDQALSTELWDICRVQARPRLENLAQRIKPVATWDDIVLPAAQRATLREIAVQVRQRMQVYETWGFAARSSRGLGISALFTGSSGTGKTMAAEVLANELRLDLFRIDLSQVVSKYIGETEKNLRKVFDAAEEGGAILLFDEADALFGKRSEVKDSHDRYANIEISYLLQRMEDYRGLAILTTNMKSALDTAFLRRIRVIVEFPFPDAGARAEIWRRIFPPQTPTEGLVWEKLGCLNVPGGNIRNIALHAAFLAADAGEPVRMAHLLRAARTEYNKLEKALTGSEIRGWV